jgi:MFS family permease
MQHAARGRAPKSRGDNVTSPASGAGSAPDPPGYAPIAQSVPGPQSVTGRGVAVGDGSRRLGLALLVIATAQLMVVLDATIVNVALPHIQRVFVFGLLLFSGASLLGGFAPSEWWLLTARAVQGAGGAVIAPTALALITTNFPEGAERNRAFGVYAAMAGLGSAVGLLLGAS